MPFRIVILLVILFAIDFYVFQGVKVLTQKKIVHTVYWCITAMCLLTLLIGNFIDWHSWPKVIRTYSFAIIVAIYIFKLFVILFLLIDDVLRLFRWIANYVNNTFFNTSAETAKANNTISRYEFLTKLGFIVGAIPFLGLLYGMIGGQYRYQLRKVNLKFPNLPSSFNGLKVIQISDLHSGSFISSEPLERAVKIILDEKPDVIFFTGDLVNDRYVEAVEFAETFRKIKAPLGVYSILGNHDYGDYFRWKNIEEKKENFSQLKKLHGELGWKILLNEHTFIERENEKIGLIGVENWSAHMSFHKYGDMNVATNGMTPADFNILLSHDPSHWQAQVIDKHKYVDLTLSGHTHGFQFGIEIPGFKWSPVQYVYKEWADLYQNENQYLYVNRGLGFIGYPGRVGILPEITLFTLNKS